MPKITKRSVLLAAQVLEDKKAQNIIVLDVRKITSFTSFFLIATANSITHIKSLTDALIEKLEEKGYKIMGYEGMPLSGWWLLDYGDMIVHIFGKKEREYYNLERIWADAKVILKKFG